MALTIKKIPEQTFLLGPGGSFRAYQCAPAASDYVAGGYLITPQQVDMSRIVGAIQLSQKYSSGGTIVWQTSLPAAAYGTTPSEGSSTGIYLVAYWSPGGTSPISAGELVEVTASTDLSAFPVELLFLGY